MAQLLGTVKWFNNAKGYGFLGHDGGNDVFVHYSSILDDGYKSLTEGEPVAFDIIQGDKGPQADKVSRKLHAFGQRSSPEPPSSPEENRSALKTQSASPLPTKDKAD